MRHDDPRRWSHPLECGCIICEHDHPAVEPPLDWVDLARFGTLGGMGGAVGTMLLAPMRSAHALVTILTDIAAALGLG